MQSRLIFILKYWLAWIIFFEIARLLFLLKNYEQASAAGISEISGSLWNGLRMDASMAAYLVLPVIIFSIISLFVHFFTKPVIYKTYTGIVLFICLVLILIDMNLFQAWSYRIDASFLKYLSNPKEVYASVSHLPLAAILVAFILGFILFYLVFSRRIEKWTRQLKPAFNNLWSVFIMLFFAALMIIPLRGGLQLAPLNQSSVYFSSNNFANQAAINASWNFMHALMHRSNETENPYLYLEPSLAARIVDSLYSKKTVDSVTKTGPKPDIILIIAESFTSKAIGLVKDGIEVTPGMNKLSKQGFYYSNIYSSGDRTDKGIVAILSGYPSQPSTSIVKNPSKAAKLPMLPKLFREHGYSTSFYYGGELEFANMKAYLMSGGYDNFISIDDFEKKDHNSKWGAHDGVVMQRFYNGIEQAKSPFFYTWLTLSSHEPFETPVQSVFSGKDDESAFLNSVHYTDSVIYRLILRLQNLPTWKNTIVVVVADHGHKLPKTPERHEDFHIPLLILGGQINNQSFSGVGSQTDIASTLSELAGIEQSDFKWSQDLLDSSRAQFGYFCFNNGFGYVQNDGHVVFDNTGRRVIEQSGSGTSLLIDRGKAIQQMTFSDYLSK